MAYETIQVKKEDGIVTLMLNRPDKLNAINNRMTEELTSALAEAARDAGLKVFILTAAGRAFCAGGDLDEVLHSAPAQNMERHLLNIYRGTILQLHNLEVPTIAVVNGVAGGMGCDLALACDMRIGTPNARFFVAFTRVGLTPATGGVWLMPRIVGMAKAAELIYTADMVKAEEALKLGILNRLVPEDRMGEETMALARKIAKGPPIALRLDKMQLRKSMHTDLAGALETGAVCQAICMASEDHKEAVAAFVEKREPVFKGK